MNAIQGVLRIAQKLLRATPRGVAERRPPPSRLRRPATETHTKSETAHQLLRVARRYAETEAGRAIAAVIAVAAVVILAGLAWLWVFGN
jgi:hypothetical protein